VIARVYKARMLASVLLTAAGLSLLAQSTAPAAASGCEEGHRRFTPGFPRAAADGNIIPGQTIVRARLKIGDSAVVRVVEYPRAGADLDVYNSTIIVQRGQQQTRYLLKKLIKGGEFLRLTETTSLCTFSGQGTVLLAFEAGATGAAQGFVIIRYSADSMDVKGFPSVYQGRIVVNRSAPNRVELWSTTTEDAALCEACRKHYIVQDCEAGQAGVECTQRPGFIGPLDPGKFMLKRIEVR